MGDGLGGGVSVGGFEFFAMEGEMGEVGVSFIVGEEGV